MTIQAATPYLILNGRAREAIALYEKALGAKVELLQTFGDVDGSCPAARRDLVMHCELRFGDTRLLLSDSTGPGELPQGGLISIALQLDDPDEARRVFEVLAGSGKAIEKLFEAPWGALFGIAADAFGVGWMFNAALKK